MLFHPGLPLEVLVNAGCPGAHAGSPDEILLIAGLPGEILVHADLPGEVILDVDLPGEVIARADSRGKVGVHSSPPGKILVHSSLPDKVLVPTGLRRKILVHAGFPGELLILPGKVPVHDGLPGEVIDDAGIADKKLIHLSHQLLIGNNDRRGGLVLKTARVAGTRLFLIGNSHTSSGSQQTHNRCENRAYDPGKAVTDCKIVTSEKCSLLHDWLPADKRLKLPRGFPPSEVPVSKEVHR